MSDNYSNNKYKKTVYGILLKNPKHYVQVCKYMNGQVFRFKDVSTKADRILFYSHNNNAVYVTGLFRNIRIIMTDLDVDYKLATDIEVVDNDGVVRRYPCILGCWTDCDVFHYEHELQIEKWGVNELDIFEYHYFTQDYLDEHCVDDSWVMFDCGPENVYIMENDGNVGAFHYVITKSEGDFYYKLLDYEYDNIEIMSFSGGTTLSDEYIDRWFFMVKAKGKYGMFEMFCKDFDTDDCKIELKELVPCIYDKIDFEKHTIKLFLKNKNYMRSVNWKDVGKLTRLEWNEVFEYYARKAFDVS